jgi:hypothetical protein
MPQRLNKAEREAKRKADEERLRSKVVKETADARSQANRDSRKPPTDRIPKKPTQKKKPTGVAHSSADESDSSKSDSAKDQPEASDEDDTEEEDVSDLASGDARCRVSNCGLGSGIARFNCPRHEQAARDQAAGSQARERRKNKPDQPAEAEPSSPPTKQQARNAKRKEKQSNKLVESQVQQALTSTLAPFLEQFRTMSEQIAARAVRPCLTGYIR